MIIAIVKSNSVLMGYKILDINWKNMGAIIYYTCTMFN